MADVLLRHCKRCGLDKPKEQFLKIRYLEAGDVPRSKRTAWLCDDCLAAARTEASRKFRQDPANRALDRARSRRWKAANRERNRARDRANMYAPCPKCGGEMGRQSNACAGCRAAETARRQEVGERMWAEGYTSREIGAALGVPTWTPGPYRVGGWNLPLRYRPRSLSLGEHLRESAAEVQSLPLTEQRSQAIRGQAPPRHGQAA